MTANKNKDRSATTLVWEFIKLQIAGNILFLGTLIGFFIGDKLVGTKSIIALVSASIVAHILFFIANRKWVFSQKVKLPGDQSTRRFVIFMILNFFLGIALIELYAYLLRANPDSSITTALFTVWNSATEWMSSFVAMQGNWELYVAQFLSGLTFTLWSFVGLRYWVFAPIVCHAGVCKHQGINFSWLKSKDGAQV
ncbi:hypothetical protein GX865_01345 [Candidatus Saccharibacteria bacterium]|jgi:putative flippase GtrA|nr:hypothetical protein [Candidatus Saccharibacteria bacterium]